MNPCVFPVPAGSYEFHYIANEVQWMNAGPIARSLMQGFVDNEDGALQPAKRDQALHPAGSGVEDWKVRGS